MEPKHIRKLLLGTAAVISVIVIWPFASVPAGHRGVVTTFGKPGEEAYGEGIHFLVPLAQRMNLVNVSIQRSDDKGQAASRDLQTVEAVITLNYHVLPSAAVSVFRNLGNDPENRVIVPAVQEAVKATTARYTAEELVSKREAVRNSITTDLSERMQRHGMAIDEMSVTSFSFSKSFDEAIEAKTTAEQLKLKADRDLERIRVEAEQKVVRAEAEAKSLAAQRQQITEELLSLRRIENERAAIEKWNGQLPGYVTSGGTMPFINLGKQP